MFNVKIPLLLWRFRGGRRGKYGKQGEGFIVLFSQGLRRRSLALDKVEGYLFEGKVSWAWRNARHKGMALPAGSLSSF